METAGGSGGDESNAIVRGLASGVEWVAHHALATIAVCAALTGAAVYYSSQTVRMNSDDSTLISQDEPFRQHYKRLNDRFPQFDETTLIVITTTSLDLAEDAVDRLAAALGEREDLISTLYAPSAEPFFEDHAFLYLDDDELNDVIERLAEAQPALTALVEDPSLRGLFDEFELSLQELAEGEELPSGYTRMANRVSEATEKMLAGKPQRIGWADELVGDDEVVYRLIIVQGQKFFDEPISSARLIDGIRETALGLGLTPENGVRVRLTGMVPLAHEEQESLQSGLALAGAVALTLLTIILSFGIRSLRIIIATLAALVCGLTWTTAYAMLVVGEFNIISAAFGVLLIGLGVDFAIHLGLAYEEETRRGLPVPQALRRATEEVGGAVSLCALTSAIGFFAFIPTRYYGLAALGIISGGGILISLIATFTVFPAVLATMRAPSKQHTNTLPLLGRLFPTLANRSGTLVLGTAIVSVAAIATATQTTFDFSALGMKDARSESMTTLRELQEQDIVTDYSATILAPSMQAAEQMAGELEALELVTEVRTPSSYLPENQAEKISLLEDAAFFLESVLFPEPPKPAPTASERRVAVESLRDKIAALPPGDEHDPARVASRRLGEALDRVAATPDPEATIDELEQLVVSDLEERVEWLRTAIGVQEVGFDDLPSDLRDRLVADDGTVRVVALPTQDLSRVESLIAFVEAVQALYPEATGRPAVEAGIGDIVVDTFRTAISIAVILVGLILFVVLRNPIDALIVLLPISLAAFLTIAFGVVAGISLNMANVVVVPLVIGLGVDNGIHVFMRFRQGGDLEGMMRSSTPRAVMLSALTTLAAFGSLSLSDHWGIHSMGVLLSFAVVSMTICTLVVLPAMILLLERVRGERAS